MKKNEPFEQLKSTESLKRERPQNKPDKRTKYIKTALQIAKNETPKERKAKEQDLAEKLNSERIRALQTAQKTPLKKRAGWKMAEENSVKKSH